MRLKFVRQYGFAADSRKKRCVPRADRVVRPYTEMRRCIRICRGFPMIRCILPGGAEPRPYQNCAYFWGCSEICCGRIRSAQNWEQELLVFLGVHIFPRNEDAGNLNEIVGLLAVCHANGLLDGHVAHVERPLRDNGLNDVLL